MSAKKILVVDDDTRLLAALAGRLQRSGYDVVTAEDSVCAISIARRERPDLVLLDLGLPGGGGFVVMDRMKHLPELRLVPVVVLSGSQDPTIKRRAFAADAFAFVEKGNGSAGFLGAIRSALIERPQAVSVFMAT